MDCERQNCGNRRRENDMPCESPESPVRIECAVIVRDGQHVQ